MRVSAIVLAAGKGVRIKSRVSKPLIEIYRRPILIYCLKILSDEPLIKEIIVVANAGNIGRVRDAIRRHKIKKTKGVVLGGILRQDSVLKGLRAVNVSCDFVLIHDGVRPLLCPDIVSNVLKEAARSRAAIVGVPVKQTIKEVTTSERKPPRRGPRQSASLPEGDHVTSGIVKRTLNRDNLWEIQTPQVFKKDLLLKAYDRFGSSEVTDDAMLVEKMGTKVSVVFGSYDNIKITTPEDLVLTKAILKSQRYNTN